MKLLKTQQLLHLPNLPLSNIFIPVSLTAIKTASSPQQAIHLYKTWIQRQDPGADPFDTHAAVFTIKACTRFSINDTPLLPHLHAFLFKTSIFTNVHVATVLLHGYALSSFQDARQLFDEIPHRNVVTENTMISCYSNYGYVSEARSLFNTMVERDIASWSAMIGGYVNQGKPSLGLGLFREMMSSGQFKPDQLVLVTLLSGCASTGSLRLLGKSIHAYCVNNGLEINEQLGTALVDMYAKCGCLRSAFSVFERMPDKTVMHWSAMICGLALHGHGRDAVAFFEEMRKVGVKPNAITFTGVLSACCHAGLVDEGQRYFCTMVEEFGCEPSIHHYGCMVDMYAKAGRLEDAYRVIKNMKAEPNIVVWSSFLAACRKHKNFEIVEEVLEQVLQISDPERDGGVYTLISDLYALGSRWNDAERVRKLMDKIYVKKNRGSCFIEVEETSNSAIKINL